jgi:hypothetical protein
MTRTRNYSQPPDHDTPVEAFAPTSAREAALLKQFPIAKPVNPNREFVRRNGRLTEIVSDAAAAAIEAYLAGEDVAVVNDPQDGAAP